MNEFSSNPPRTIRELFNHRHASLRNAIERAFGLLKKRFPIISSANEPTYEVKTHKLIVLACCILHNYLLGIDPDESLLAEVDERIRNRRRCRCSITEEDDEHRGELVRDSLASAMWIDYSHRT